jgi:hypothetical protein
LADLADSKSAASGFESRGAHHPQPNRYAPVVKLVKTADLDSVFCEFESHLEHQAEAQQLQGRKPTVTFSWVDGAE